MYKARAGADLLLVEEGNNLQALSTYLAARFPSTTCFEKILVENDEYILRRNRLSVSIAILYQREYQEARRTSFL